MSTTPWSATGGVCSVCPTKLRCSDLGHFCTGHISVCDIHGHSRPNSSRMTKSSSYCPTMQCCRQGLGCGNFTVQSMARLASPGAEQTKMQPKEEGFGRISLQTSGQKLRSPGKTSILERTSRADVHEKTFSLKKLGADFPFPTGAEQTTPKIPRKYQKNTPKIPKMPVWGIFSLFWGVFSWCPEFRPGGYFFGIFGGKSGSGHLGAL